MHEHEQEHEHEHEKEYKHEHEHEQEKGHEQEHEHEYEHGHEHGHEHEHEQTPERVRVRTHTKFNGHTQSDLKFLRMLTHHMDRRKNFMSICLVLPHEMNPEDLGDAKDCEWCKDVEVSSKAREFLDLLKANGGFMFSPSLRLLVEEALVGVLVAFGSGSGVFQPSGAGGL